MLFWEKFLNFKFIQIFNSWSLSDVYDETRTHDLLIHRQKPNRLCHKTNKTVKFVDGDVLEARRDETPESTFTEEVKAENTRRIIAWVLTYIQIFTLICSVSTNVLKSQTYHCFCYLPCFLLTYIFNKLWKENVHFHLKWTRWAWSSEKKYKGTFSDCSTTKNSKLFRRNHLQ